MERLRPLTAGRTRILIYLAIGPVLLDRDVIQSMLLAYGLSHRQEVGQLVVPAALVAVGTTPVL